MWSKALFELRDLAMDPVAELQRVGEVAYALLPKHVSASSLDNEILP